MTIKTTAERLSEVDDAISQVLEAQMAGQGDKQLLRARLKDLADLRNQINAQYQAERGTGGISFNTGLIYRD